MKKIGSIFKRILLFFDKWLITPITKGILSFSDFSKNNGKEFEKFINKKQTLIILSLIFAFMFFFMVDQNSNMLVNNQAEILYAQPVTAEYNAEAYVIEGLPTTADITLIGGKSQLYIARQYPNNGVSIDLTGLKPGSHKVSLKYQRNLSSIKYKIDPSTATIVIYEKVPETRELDYDILHRDHLDKKLVINSVDLSRNDVIIKGAEYKLQQVATVKALIDIDNISNIKEGNVTLSNIPLIAYDSKGIPVDVEIVPEVVDATLKIASPSKDVELEIIPIGEPALGKSIKEIKASIPKVTLYGDTKVLDKIDKLPVEIDVTELNTTKEYNINLKKPSGVREISSKTVNVTVELDDVVTKEITGIRITPINLAPGLAVQAASQENSTVTVIVKGSADVISQLDESTITATVDLKNYQEGIHDVKLEVSGTDVRLSYESKITKVRVRIYANK